MTRQEWTQHSLTALAADARTCACHNVHTTSIYPYYVWVYNIDTYISGMLAISATSSEAVLVIIVSEPYAPMRSHTILHGPRPPQIQRDNRPARKCHCQATAVESESAAGCDGGFLLRCAQEALCTVSFADMESKARAKLASHTLYLCATQTFPLVFARASGKPGTFGPQFLNVCHANFGLRHLHQPWVVSHPRDVHTHTHTRHAC